MAMIEILKNNFSLCEHLLRKFEKVDDPYILERLYGIVFGSCSKRCSGTKEEYNSLVDYVYNFIFKPEKTYPDILLRDYARLIIERFKYEYNVEKGYERINPPYYSDVIPEVSYNDWSTGIKQSDGVNSIINSMAFPDCDCIKIMSGDFGEYIFERRIRRFDIDHTKVFNYAMYFIFRELKYSVGAGILQP